MENTGTVYTQVPDCSFPRSNNHGRGQPQENVRLWRWEKGVAIKDNVIIVEKVGPSKYKFATKTDKKEERKFIQTANISYSHVIFTNCSTYTNLIK